MYALGIDTGSVATKAVLFNGTVAGSTIIPTGWSPRDASRQALEKLILRCSIRKEEIKKIIATGYGRVSLEYADKKVTEISCHAKGASFLIENTRTVLDIGGQDSKVISLDSNGNTTDFVMNDKCAAGTGRFLEVMANLLGAEVQELDLMASGSSACRISSMCTVFAESEIISLLAQGVSKESIARGVLESIACRAVALTGRLKAEPAISFTGGVSKSTVLKEMIEEKLGIKLFTCPDAQLAGALGAAIIGWQMLRAEKYGMVHEEQQRRDTVKNLFCTVM